MAWLYNFSLLFSSGKVYVWLACITFGCLKLRRSRGNQAAAILQFESLKTISVFGVLTGLDVHGKAL
jgi:hypothetical protein